MTNLIYKNYLKVETFNIEDEYIKKLYTPKFQKRDENILKRFDRYKRIDENFKNVFFKISLKSILLSKEKDLDKLIIEIEPRIDKLVNPHRNSFLKKLKKLFDYTNKYQSSTLTPFFTDNFNSRTCFYCNKDFINNFEKEKDSIEDISSFQLDHFYDKATYPYLALSFYNLIPSCYVCNAKVKGSKNVYIHDPKVGTFDNETCISPNSENFTFDEKVKFKLYLDKSCENLHIKDKEDIDIELKEYYSNDYDKYIEVFKLNERYKAHKDIVYDMITKAELYPESRLKELQDLTGIPFQQIKKDIFNLIDENEDLSKKPFSKLIKDISEELGL